MKNKKLIVIIGIVLLVTLIISIVLLLKNDKTKNTDINKDNSIIKEENSNIDKDYTGYIEWNDNDNVEIIEEEKHNVSKKITEEHNYGKYKFNDMKIYTKEEKVYLEFLVTNLSDDGDDVMKNIFIRFIDKDNNVVYFMSYTLPDLKIGESKKEEMKIYVDASNAYDYVVEGF